MSKSNSSFLEALPQMVNDHYKVIVEIPIRILLIILVALLIRRRRKRRQGRR